MRRTRINPVSKKRKERDKEYPAARQAVWERGNGVCEFCCAASLGEIHHLAGRGGVDPHRYTGDWRDPRNNLVGLCQPCHQMAHGNPAWAREVGLMRSRIEDPDRLVD